MSFQHRLTARFYEIDRAGIVFFGRFFEYCHAAFEELLAAAFGDLEPLFTHGTWGLPLVHVEADFARPVRIGEGLVIDVTLDRVGPRSLTFLYEVTGQDGVLRARVRHKHAVIDRATFTPRDVPAELLEGLARAGVKPRVTEV